MPLQVGTRLGTYDVLALIGAGGHAMLRAYGKATGVQVGALWMPAAQSGSPMIYMVDRRQYIVVAVSGGNYSGEYLAFSLPEEAATR